MKLPVFFCLIAAITFAINANAGRRASTPNSQVDGFFLRLYLPSLANENGEPNQFYIYKVIPSRSYLFEPEFINDDPSHFVPYTFLNKADFISFFNPKKPNKTVFRIVMGEDSRIYQCLDPWLMSLTLKVRSEYGKMAIFYLEFLMMTI